MIINYLDNISDFYLHSFFGKHESLRMNKVNSILTFSILMQRMASTDLELNHLFDTIRRTYLINSLLNQLSHS